MQTSARQNYPADVPHEIHPEQYRSLPHMFDEAFGRYAERPFSVCMERWMSYGELDALSKALGAWLQSLGLEPGARVAIMLPNIPQFAVTMCGVLRAGYTCVNVNPLYTARELEHQLKDSGATAIVILENFASTLEKVIERTPVKHVVMTSMGDLLGGLYGAWITVAVRHLAKMVPAYKLPLDEGRTVTPFTQAIAEGRGRTLGPDQSTLDSIAFLQYTGGTTGPVEGRGADASQHRRGHAAGRGLVHAGAVARRRPAKVNSIAALPLYHIFALTLCLLVIRQGSHMTLIPNPRDFNKFIAVLKKRPFHMLPAVNTLFNALLMHPEFKSIDFSTLFVSQAGGMAASEGTARKWFETTGCPMIEGWGMSETCAIGTNNPVSNTTFTGTIGLPLPSIEIAIKDDDGHSMPTGEPANCASRDRT
jgi:long-chain acyl-CoA synthetase